MSDKDDLVGVVLLSATNALDAIDGALQSTNPEVARQLMQQAKSHILVLRSFAAAATKDNTDKPQ